MAYRLELLSAAIAELKRAVTGHMIATLIFLDYHFAVGTAPKVVSALEGAGHKFIAFALVGQIQTLPTVLAFADTAGHFRSLKGKHSLALLLSAQFYLRVGQHFLVSADFLQFFAVNFLQLREVRGVFVELNSTGLLWAFDGLEGVEVGVEDADDAALAEGVLLAAEEHDLNRLLLDVANGTQSGS